MEKDKSSLTILFDRQLKKILKQYAKKKGLVFSSFISNIIIEAAKKMKEELESE